MNEVKEQNRCACIGDQSELYKKEYGDEIKAYVTDAER